MSIYDVSQNSPINQEYNHYIHFSGIVDFTNSASQESRQRH